MSNESFGSYMREKRIEMKLSLRSFCERFGYDTAYISRMENNLLAPPGNKKKLGILANCLGFKEDTQERVKFFDLAYKAKQKIPEDIQQQASEIMSKLPAFLRTPNGTRVSQKKVKDLLEFISKGGE